MCRGLQQNGPDCLKLKAFYVRLSLSPAKTTTRDPLPEFLTLNYLPRIDDGPLEINGSKIRPDASGFVMLHRVVSAEAVVKGAVYGSRERVRAGEGVRFEVHAGDSRLVKGIFRRDRGENWGLDCECVAAAGEVSDCLGIKEAEVCVAAEGPAAAMISRKVEMVHPRRLRRRRCYQRLLEEIPEGRETERETEESETGDCCCCRCGGEGEAEMDGGDFETAAAAAAEEGVGWAVDVGLWVLCLGVGYLVSRNTLKRLRRKLR